INPLDIVQLLGQCLSNEGLDARASPSEKLMDQLDGARPMPRVFLGQLFRFTSPRRIQDIVHVIDAGENLINLVDSIWLISSTLVRQRLCEIFGQVLKIFLKDLRKIFLKE